MYKAKVISSRSFLGILVAAAAIAGCGKTVQPAVEPVPPPRSADEIIAAARLSPEALPRAAFEVHRLDAFAACSAAQARFEGRARFRLESKGASGASTGLIGGIVIGGLGLVGGITTTALAASLKAPPIPDTPPAPNAELPDVEGKTGVVVAGVLTGVAVVGAAVITIILATKGGDDDDDKKNATLDRAPGAGRIGSGVGDVGGAVGGAAGGVVGGVGDTVGGIGGAAGGALGKLGGGASGQVGVGASGPGGVGVSGQVGVGGSGRAGIDGSGNAGGGADGRASAAASAKPVASLEDIAARLSAFQSECSDNPSESALAACTDRARVLRLSCSAGR